MPTADGIVFVGVKSGNSFKEKNLWFSNGTETRLLRDFTNGEEDVAPVLLGKVGDKVIVGSGNQRLGYSLWSTDGTNDRTVRILHSPSGLSWPTWGTASETPDGRLLIAFFDAQLGREIWITDGTATGTELFSDIQPGANNSNPRFSFFGEKVLAFATTTAYGAQEPFVADFNEFVPTRSNLIFKAFVDENHLGAYLGSIQLSDIPASEIEGFRLHNAEDTDRYFVDEATGALRLQPTFALDFESATAATVDVDVYYRDPFVQDTLIRTIKVEIQVVNRVEAPIIKDQIFEVDENLDLGEFVGKLVVSADSKSSLEFFRTAGRPFNINPDSGQIYVLDPNIMDYESNRELVFETRVSDLENALSSTAKVTIRLRDVDEPPVLSQPLAPTPRTIFSGAETTLQFPLATFVDPEGLPVVYRVSLANGNDLPSWLTFDADARELTAAPTPNEVGEYTLRLTATDAGGNAASVTFVLTVLDGRYPWYNAISPFDVNRDGRVSPLDALLVINRLNRESDRTLPSTNPLAQLFYDTNRDGAISPIDVLLIINELNGRSGSAEGEQDVQVVDTAFADIDSTLSNLRTTDFDTVDLTRRRRTR